MENPMTTSPKMTRRQIERMLELFRAQLVAHGSEMASMAVQIVMGQEDFPGELLSVVKNRVAVASKISARWVKVNRGRDQPAMLKAAALEKDSVDSEVLRGMPREGGDDVQVFFFSLAKFGPEKDMDKEFAMRGLVPVDPYALGAVVEADPSFLLIRNVFTYWTDAQGERCYLTISARTADEFSTTLDGYFDCGHHSPAKLPNYWTLAGVRKSSPAPK